MSKTHSKAHSGGQTREKAEVSHEQLESKPQGSRQQGGRQQGSGQQGKKERNLQEIRDILIGSQMRDYEGRFRSLETRVQNALDTMRQDFGERMNAIEAGLLQELKNNQQQLTQEQTQRQQDLQAAQQLWQQNLSQNVSNEQTQRKQDIEAMQQSLQHAIQQQGTQAEEARQRIVAEHNRNLEQQLQTIVLNYDQKLGQNDKKLLQLEQQNHEAQQDIRQKLLEQYKTLSKDIVERVGLLEQQIQQDVDEYERRKLDRNALSTLFMETALRLADDSEISALSQQAITAEGLPDALLYDEVHEDEDGKEVSQEAEASLATAD